MLSLLLLANAAFAQVTTSNLGSSVGANMPVRSNNWMGQAFTTDANNYTLDSVTLQMGAATATGGVFSVSIFSANGSNPGSLLETLSGSTSPFGSGNYTFTSTGLSLAPNNTYHVVAVVTGGLGDYSWQDTSVTSETGPWVFPNYFTTSTNQGGGWSQTGASMIMSVTATPIPEPGTYAAVCGALALGLAAWRRRSVG